MLLNWPASQDVPRSLSRTRVLSHHHTPITYCRQSVSDTDIDAGLLLFLYVALMFL